MGVQGYFHGNNHLNTGYNSLLPGLTDFNLYDALHTGLNENFGWYEGLARIYHNLSQDYMYGDVMKNVLFLSNHDVSRFYSMMNENVDKFKMAITFLMTTRGMVQWYYGDEISEDEFRNRLANQMDIKEKLEASDFKIINDKDIDHLLSECKIIYREITQRRLS